MWVAGLGLWAFETPHPGITQTLLESFLKAGRPNIQYNCVEDYRSKILPVSEAFIAQATRGWEVNWVLELYLLCSIVRAPAIGVTWVSWTFSEHFLSVVWKLGWADGLDKTPLSWRLQKLKGMSVGCSSLLSARWGTQVTASSTPDEQQSGVLWNEQAACFPAFHGAARRRRST